MTGRGHSVHGSNLSVSYTYDSLVIQVQLATRASGPQAASATARGTAVSATVLALTRAGVLDFRFAY